MDAFSESGFLTLEDEHLESPSQTAGRAPAGDGGPAEADRVLRLGADVVRWDLDPGSTEPPPEEDSFCIVECRGRVLGLPGETCSGVRHIEGITPLPLAPGGVLGLARLEAEILPVLDLASALGSDALRTGAVGSAPTFPEPPSTTILVSAEPAEAALLTGPASGGNDRLRALVVIDSLLGFEPIGGFERMSPAAGADSVPGADSAARLPFVRGEVELDGRGSGLGGAVRVSIVDMAGILRSVHTAASGGSS